MERGIYRCIDASLDRAVEGLRVLMDVCRFSLDQTDLSERLKHLRHELVLALSRDFSQRSVLVNARDSQLDVSRPQESSPIPAPYLDEAELFSANMSRVQEAARSLEESLRLFDPAKARQVENIRYRLYDLQKEAQPWVEKLSLRRLMDFELYVVTDRTIGRNRPIDKLAGEAIRGGAGCIQLREKTADIQSFIKYARLLRKVTREEGATFIINDSLDIALDCEADGVHLGQEDLPLEVARKISAGRLLAGISTHNREQALAAEKGGAGYINLGPIFQTATKGVPVKPVSTGFIREMKPLLSVPFTTMGGIHLDNVAEVILAGADRVAVVSEVMGADDVEKAARLLLDEIHRAKEARAEKQAL